MRHILSISLLTLVLTSVRMPAQAISTIAQTKVSSGTSSPLARNISIDLADVTVDVAVRAIAQKAGVPVTYSRARIFMDRKVSLRSGRISVEDAIRRVTAPVQVRISVLSDGQIVIAPVESQGRNAVQGIIAGRVVDGKTGKGVAGANVSVANNTKGVVTEEDGSYRLSGVAAGNHVISVRLVGYAKQSRSVTVGEGATATVDFQLEPSANVLDQVVVTGTIISTELKAVPNAISVITAKEIEERGITRIDQLFRGDIPGLFSLNMGSGSTLDEVVMFSRGATALSGLSSGVSKNSQTAEYLNTNPIKTYVDGVEMVDPQYLSQIDPSSIERIEILTGPQASTIYGSNAINGVMQIFTKRGVANRPQLTVNLSSGVTQNNFSSAVAPKHIVDAGATGIEGRVSYNVGGSWNYEGSWTPGKQVQRLSAYGGGRMDAGKIVVDLSARQGLTKNRQNGNTAQLNTQLFTAGMWKPNGQQGQPNPRTQTLDGRTMGLSLSYRPLSWWSHEILLGSDVSSQEAIETAPGFTSRIDTTLVAESRTATRVSQSYNSTLQIPVSGIARLNLTFGGDHWRATGSSWNIAATSLTGSFSGAGVTRNKPDKNGGAYIQSQLGFADALFFTYGVRADWNPNFGDDVKVKPGRYGVSYTRDVGSVSVKMRGSYGRSIRPPGPGLALSQSASSAGLSSDIVSWFGDFDWYLANPALGPEHQSGGEGGIELYLGSRGSLVVTRFNQTVDNLISRVGRVDSVRSVIPLFPSITSCNFGVVTSSVDTEGHCFYPQNQYINVGSIRNQGWELQGSVNLGPLTTRGTYSWVKSRIIGVTPAYRYLLTEFQPGRSFDYTPEHAWALRVTYAKSSSTVSLSLNGVGMRYISTDNLFLMITDSRGRFLQVTSPRMLLGGYRPQVSGYATADINATHRFSPRMDALLQISNLTDYYRNDFNVSYASSGRSSRIGLRIRM